MRYIQVLGVPLGIGAGIAGSEQAPAALRQAGLSAKLGSAGYQVVDLGDVVAPNSDSDRFDHIAAWCQEISATLRSSRNGGFPLVLGGDHSISMGSVPGLYAASQPAVVWIDAHGDFNIPATSPSGNAHGMSLAALAGLGDARFTQIGGADPKVKPDQIVLFGARDLDPGERALLLEQRVHGFSPEGIREQGIAAVAGEVLRLTEAAPALHISLDLDVLDPSVAPGVGTPVAGGLWLHELGEFLAILAASGRVASLELVEVNPALDSAGATAIAAIDLAHHFLAHLR